MNFEVILKPIGKSIKTFVQKIVQLTGQFKTSRRFQVNPLAEVREVIPVTAPPEKSSSVPHSAYRNHADDGRTTVDVTGIGTDRQAVRLGGVVSNVSCQFVDKFGSRKRTAGGIVEGTTGEFGSIL
jgi:hypothetical protein